jgi:molecular chaperone DnaK (HSP70)
MAPDYPFGIFKLFVFILDMTADITVLQQTYNGQLKVLCRATGDDCGGTSVDDRLCNMLEEIVGKNVTTESKRKEPMKWLDMLHDFRNKIGMRTKVFRLRYPCSLNEICEELHGKDVHSVIKSSSYVNEITLVGDKLKFKADLMIKLFTPTIDSIITLMKNTVSNRSTNGVSNNVSNIVMVGRLSECPMIQDAVYKAFPDNQIIIPRETGLYVLCGAVLFGHRPDYIWSELRDEEGIGK